MFPYSSSSNTTNCDYQLPFPSVDFNNQTQLLDYGNPNSTLSSHAHHIHQQYSYGHDHLPPANFLEHDGLLLSYLLSHQQLSLTNTNNINNPTSQHLQPHHPHDTAQISVAGSNSNNSSVEKEETIVPINVPDVAPSKGSSSCSKVKKNNTKIVNNGEQAEKKAKGPPRKRSSGKNDRHSKIYTAQGPRDRRMRLSLQIARKFFDLQDMLGFDKASKTIDWLFTKSKSSIKELKQGFLSSPSSSSEAAAAADYSCTANPSTNNSESNSEATNADSSAVGAAPPVEKKARKLCVVAKESRVEARARARERTREKMMHTWIKSGFDNIDHQELPNPNDDLGGQPYLSWPSNCPINNPGILMNPMMKCTNHQVEAKSEDYTAPTSSLNFSYSSISSGHGANSEDYAFPGFSGNQQY